MHNVDIENTESSPNAIRRTFKNALMLLFGTMFRMVVSFVFVIFAADKLGVAGFGIYSIGIHYFELFLSLTSTAVGILLTREIAKTKNASRLIGSAFAFTLALAVAGAGCMAGLAWLFGFSAITNQVILIAAVALIPASLSAICEAIFIAYEKAEFVAFAVSVESTLRVFASIAAIVAGYGLVTLFLILVASRVIQLVVFAVCMRSSIKTTLEFSWSSLVNFVKSWRVFAAENWMATLYTNLDVLVLSWLTGEVAVGLYSAAWKIVRLGSVAAKAYTTAVFPLLSRLYQNARGEFAKTNMDTIRLMIVIALPIVVTTTILADRVIGLVYFSGKYTAAVPVLQILIWVLLLEFLNPFLSHTLFARGRQDRSMQVAGISLVINSILTLGLVYQYGAVGAAIGTVVAGLVATCAYVCFSLNSQEIFATASSTVRALIASLIVGCVLFVIRDANLLFMIPLGIATYAFMVVVMRLVSTEDLRLVKSIVSSRTA